MRESVQSLSGQNRINDRVFVFVEPHGRCSQVVAIFIEVATFLRWFQNEETREVLYKEFRGVTWQRSGNLYTLNPKP